jgi:hypothetical protein
VNEPAAALPRLSFDFPEGADFSDGVHHEWLLTNGRGGYASGTVLMARLEETALVRAFAQAWSVAEALRVFSKTNVG